MDFQKQVEAAARRAGMSVRRMDRNFPVHGVPPGLPEDVAKRIRDRAKQARNGKNGARGAST